MTEIGMLLAKLSQFRRHPDWNRAHDRVVHSSKYSYLWMTFKDGRRALPNENVVAFFDVIDQEFIDEIIRNERTNRESEVANSGAESGKFENS
jgi:hypothetical protein